VTTAAAFCDERTWDGPYQMACDLALLNGRCPRHGQRDAECRYCSQRVILGKHGWRLNVDDSSGYECPDAPRGYHGIDKAGSDR
jgi:hypothetical protein